jgi:Phospholipase_D-nuclease N-terminal
MVFTIVDIVTIDGSRVRGLPKYAWVGLAIVLSFIGSLLWFLIGREPIQARSHGRYSETIRTTSTSRRGPTAPDDDTEFLGKLSREAEQEERIRQLEKRLAELDDDKPKD